MAVNKFDNSMLDAGTIGTTANKLLQLDGSAKIPAVDGSLLTSIPSSFTKNASDPALNTNPSGGVGTLWANTTSGEVYVCTDATAGANVWKNVGAGSGNVQLVPQYQGTNYGYDTAGFTPPSTIRNIIEKFSFTSDGNATDVGDLATGWYHGVGVNNNDFSQAYLCGSGTAAPYTTDIQKHSLSSDGNGTTSAADMITGGQWHGRASSATHGYAYGIYISSYPVPGTIEKFQLAAETNATDVGDLSTARHYVNSNTSPEYGWCTGGQEADNTRSDVIDKFPFASDSNATDIANLSSVKNGGNGQSSATHGYCCGGQQIWSFITDIDKFAYASTANAVDIGNLTTNTSYTAGCQSTTYGYNVGGWTPSNNIEKFSFTTDGNSTDIGDMTVQRSNAIGYQS